MTAYVREDLTTRGGSGEVLQTLRANGRIIRQAVTCDAVERTLKRAMCPGDTYQEVYRGGKSKVYSYEGLKQAWRW